MEYKIFPAVVIKSDADKGIIDAIFAVFGNVDQGDDRIHNGAFTKTFAERGGKVLVLDQHNADSIMCSLGKPLLFKEMARDELPPELLLEHPDATGGAFASIQFLMDTPEGKGAFIRLRDKAISEWSFAYDVLDTDFSQESHDGKDVTVRNIRTLKLFEISPVLFGMNSATTTTSAKGTSEKTEQPIATRYKDFIEEWNIPVESGGELQEAIMFYLQSKAGRVLSARNATRINGAIASLIEALDNAGVELDGFTRTPTETDEDEKDDDAPADEQAARDDEKQGAGPDSPPTLEVERQKLLLEIAQQI